MNGKERTAMMESIRFASVDGRKEKRYLIGLIFPCESMGFECFSYRSVRGTPGVLCSLGRFRASRQQHTKR